MNTLHPELNCRYFPEELGLPFPEVRSIWIGECPADVGHAVDSSRAAGHTHQCFYDALYGTICIADNRFVFNKDGSISDLMWHEYGHVIDFDLLDHYHSYCLSGDEAIIIGWQEIVHGPQWERVMIEKLNKPHLARFDLPDTSWEAMGITVT